MLKTKNQQFDYSEVINITNNFERVIGRGGFATVYYGQLRNGKHVAAKVLSHSFQGSNEFQTEVKTFSNSISVKSIIIIIIFFCYRHHLTPFPCKLALAVYVYFSRGHYSFIITFKQNLVDLLFVEFHSILTTTARSCSKTRIFLHYCFCLSELESQFSS